MEERERFEARRWLTRVSTGILNDEEDEGDRCDRASCSALSARLLELS